MLWHYRARLDLDHPNHDGDTVWLLLDQGLGGRQSEPIRLLDVHAPELNQPGGPECAAALAAWLDARRAGSWPLIVRTVPTRDHSSERRSFTRYLGEVWGNAYSAPAGVSANEHLRLLLAAHPEWSPGS